MMPLREENSLQSAYNVRAYGAAGDGRALDTRALQSAIDACAEQGGGTVYVPAGCYLTGSLFLRSNITFYVEAGALLLGSEDPADYPPVVRRWEGSVRTVHAPLIGGQDLHDIAVTGRGTIDGRGEGWWQSFRAR